MTEHVRILHVEDSDRDAELVREVLLAEGLDCEIVRVETREQYIAALETRQFDLIVCDYTLPSFEGGEALEIAATKWSHLPFLFVSGTIGEEKAVEALKRGAAEYVLKQNLARLPSAVLRALSEAKERAERRKAEEALRASEQRTRALMENATDAILVTNIQGIVVEVNRAGEELFGRPRAEFAGCHFFDLLVADEREKARLRFEAILAGGAPGGQETIAMTADGRAVPIEISGSLVEIGGERLMLAIVRDVSERKQLEEQFRQAQKMEAVGRLAGGVAHDFNNLLTVILGYSDVVNNQLPAEHPLRQEIEQIRKAGERAAALTQQLLTFSRTQVLLPQLIDVREVVTDIHNMLRRVIGEDLDSHRRPLPPAIGSARGTETILLLEEDEGLRRLARDVLENHGYTIIETPGWQSALELAAQHAGPLDLVLADTVMPEMGSPEIVPRLSALRPGIKILTMSGGADDAALRWDL